MVYLDLNPTNLAAEHICCAFSDKKCAAGYAAKKQWLSTQFNQGYAFRRLDERAKVFIEYGPAETAWVPLEAPNYFMLGCFWVSGKYKGQGHGKALLQSVIQAANEQGKTGLVTVVGTKKRHFMSDTKWLLRQGFEVTDELDYGFQLIALDLKQPQSQPAFRPSVRSGQCKFKKGIAVYYTNRCPFSEFHVQQSLRETAARRKLALHLVHLNTLSKARSAPTPATIFSLFLDGQFITTDLSVCLDARFDRIVAASQ
ncbi:MAG: GNAT family N-acetyltransferase [Leptospiraceae bacterium]|nr:GNAT family N-acetyltransferase [Leptospiraceae bacterium]